MGKVKTVAGKNYTQDGNGNWYEVVEDVQVKEPLKAKVVNGVRYEKDDKGNWYATEEVKKKVGGEGSATNSQSKSSSTLPSTGTIDFNELNRMQGGSNRATPQQQELVQYGADYQKGIKEKQDRDIDEAATNTALTYANNNPALFQKLNLSKPKSYTGGKFDINQLKNFSSFQTKVAELKNDIKSGKLITYTANTGEKRVARPTGDWENFKTGVSEAWNANKKVNEYLEKSDADKIKFLEEFTPDKSYLPTMPDQKSGLYQVGAALPTTGKMVAAGATGAVLSAAVPETGGLSTTGLPAVLAWASVVPDMAKQNQMTSEIDAYHNAKAQGKTSEEALKIAKDAGVIGYASGLAKGTAMNFVGQTSIPTASGQGLLKAAGQFLRNQPQSIAEVTGTSLAASLAESGGKKLLGVDEDWATKAGEVLNEDAVSQLAFNVAFGAKAGLFDAPKYVKAQAYEVLSKMDSEALQMMKQRAVDEGLLTEQQIQEADQNLNDYKQAKSKIPPLDSEEKTAVIAGLIQKKQNLEKLKSESDKSFHEEIDAQIQAADDRTQLAKKSDDPIKYAEQDDLDGTRNFIPKSFEELSGKEKDGIEVPKEYGEADVTEVGGGEGSAKKYKANPYVIREQGAIKIKDKLPIEDKVYNDKADAEAAAQKALNEHYYTNAMDETLKPEKKSGITVIRPDENVKPEIVENVKVSGSETQRIPTEESGNTEAAMGEVLPTAVEEPPIPTEPNKGGVSVQYPATRLSYKGTQELSNEFGIPEREATVRKRDVQTIREADELLEKGWNADDTIKKIDEDGSISDASFINLTRYAAKLSDDLRTIGDPTKPEFETTLTELNRVAKASDKAGMQQGRDLGIRGRFKTLADESLGEYWVREKEANNEAQLTEQQKKVANEQWNEFQKAKTEHVAAVERLAEERAKFEAEKAMQAEVAKSKAKPKKTSEQKIKDADDKIKKSIEGAREALRKLRTGESGLSAVPAPGLRELIAIAPHVKKALEGLIEKGIVKLSDAVKKLKEDFEEFGVTEKNIHDILAGEYNEKKQTKSEVATIAQDLKTEAELINKLEKLLKEGVPKSEKKARKRNQEIEALSNKIKDFKKDNPNPENQLETLRLRNEKATERINEKIAKGDFEPDKKRTPLLDDAELMKKFPDLYKQALKSKDNLIKAKKDIEYRRLKQMYENRTDWEKLKDQAIRYANVPRTLMASMDFSAPLRQAIVATTAHPIHASRAFATMFKHAFSQKAFDRWFESIKETPEFKVADKAGLYISDPHDIKLTAREEAFLGNIAEKIPIAGRFVKGSERAYVSYLNKMRWDIFNEYAEQFSQQGKTVENSPKLYEALASFVNNATGRGELHSKSLESAANALNAVLFSPRLMASRLNLLFGFADKNLYTKELAPIRRMYYRDMSRFIMTGLTTLALFKYGLGADVEHDPRSSDFGKIKFGNTRWDIWGGFQPYVRVLSQVLSGSTKSSITGEIKELDAKEAFGRNEGTVLSTFARGKLSPLMSMLVDVLSRRTIIGEKVNREFDNPFSSKDDPTEGITLTDELLRHILPLIIRDVREGYKEGGIGKAAGVAIPSIFGIGTNTYEPKEKKSKKQNAISNY